MPIEDHDGRTMRCRRLGHTVAFKYCRTQEGASLCPLVLDCWWEVFEVGAFLEAHVPGDEFQRLTRPQPKMQSLLELIEQAKTHGDD